MKRRRRAVIVSPPSKRSSKYSKLVAIPFILLNLLLINKYNAVTISRFKNNDHVSLFVHGFELTISTRRLMSQRPAAYSTQIYHIDEVCCWGVSLSESNNHIPWKPQYQQKRSRAFQCSNNFPYSKLKTTMMKGCSSSTTRLLMSTISTDIDSSTSSSSLPVDDNAKINGVSASINGQQQDNIKANGINGATVTSINGANATTSSNHITIESSKVFDGPDITMPTANGGFCHTRESKAKISAANKGKTPWNKGKNRSDETRQRIAEGVRRRNRERLLQKLKDLGLTEEEYEQQKKEERRRKDRERRERRTANGGYKPTDATRKKISDVLKAKHASGEIKKRRKVDPNKVRRGFTHSAETKAKISESLKKRWATDEKYRERMIESSIKSNTNEETRKRISEKLKAKWKDPEFRTEMMSKMKSRYSPEHRARISEAMKKKWQDESYRLKATSGMAERRKELGLDRPKKPRKPKPSRPRSVTTKPKKPRKKRVVDTGIIQPIAAIQPKAKTPNNNVIMNGSTQQQPIIIDDTSSSSSSHEEELLSVSSSSSSSRIKGVSSSSASSQIASSLRSPAVVGSDGTTTTKTATKKAKKAPAKKRKKRSPNKKKKKEPDGSISRLRDERRDLFDLLYGDEEDNINLDIDGDDDDDINDNDGGGFVSDESNEDFSAFNVIDDTSIAANTLLGGVGKALMGLDDENLDNFDPYGLEDDINGGLGGDDGGGDDDDGMSSYDPYGIERSKRYR